MLDVKAVGANLTPAEQDEVMEDLSFLLDEFGSTSAVRFELLKQKADIKCLESRVNRLLNGQQHASSHEEENGDINNEDTRCSEKIIEGIDETMTNLEFFLRIFGSTRAVRDKLRIQKLKIVGLRRTLRWCERRQRSGNHSEHLGYVELVPARTPTVLAGNPIQTDSLQTDQRHVAARCDQQPAPRSTSFSPTNPRQRSFTELGVSGCASSRRKRNPCKELGCTKLGKTTGEKKGYCFQHGGGQTCSRPGCTKARIVRGLCGAHGGYYECKVEGCAKRVSTRGYCYTHNREYGAAELGVSAEQNAPSVVPI